MKMTGNGLAPKTGSKHSYALRLFIAGTSPNSMRAISNIKRICDKYLGDDYDLEIIDVYQQVDKAADEQLIALPLLVKSFPGQVRRLVGDMSDEKRVLKGLGVHIDE